MGWGVRTVSLLLCLSILLATIQRGNAERKIVCYYTNWSIYRPGTAKFSPQNINPYLCTHLIYAFGGFTKDNALKPFDKYQDIEKGGYAKFTGLKTYNKNLKTLLAIGGWNEGSSRFSPMVADSDRRREFVKNSVKFLRKNHFDGLDLDWEYPAFRDGGKPRDKDNYASLVQELREEFEREASKTGRPRLLLSLAMPAGIEYIDKGYDVPRLNEYLDFINLLSYDYHSSYEPAVNHHSPLYPLEEDNEYNYDSELTIDYTVNYLMKKGASSDKIILGIPTYGRSYTLFNQDATDLGSPADGPGVEGDATREKGYLAYYEICESQAASDDWEVIQPNPKAMGPYAFKDDQWVGYDDEDIVKLKATYANEKNLGGIMFWTIDNDDFRGKCHDRPYPLIEAAKETLLIGSTNTGEKSKTVDNRKKIRPPGPQTNTEGRKLGSTGRRTTTIATPASRKRITTPRPKFRTFSRSKASDEEEEEDQEVDRRSYNPSSDEEEDSNRGNAVRTTEKRDRPRNKNKSRPKGRSGNRNRNKQASRNDKNDSEGESLSNKLTTPEPPTTPDPGTDFKCEDEGFFPHPRDCKKYFWCLDSGPGGLGVVAHQFTCPSGLVFNKAADSCDYPRNVICPKSKPSQSTVSTTRAPITAATSRTTYLYSTTRKPKPEEKPEVEEEYDEEYEDEDEIEEEEEKETKPKVTTTPRTLLYKTIARNKPTTTTTTTTTEAPTTTSKPEKTEQEKILEDEEDPKVIKELIKLIKKAGGIEQLEKQLSHQNKSPSESSSDNERATPATISRTLYERVLSRQASKTASKQQASGSTTFANGPGGAQFQGLDEVPEVKNLRRAQKPKYVTIERPKPSTKEPPVAEDADEEENLDDDEEDVASSEEQTNVSNPFLVSSTQRATPNYINIRRSRPSTTTSRNENDVEEKDEEEEEEEEEEEAPVRSRRPGSLLKRTENSNSSEETKEQNEENQQTIKSRYVSVQRFRSTTPRSPKVSEPTPSTQEPMTESVVSSEAPQVTEKSEIVTSTPSATTLPSTAFPATPSNVLLDLETERSISNSSPETSSTTEAVKLVEESATEILLTTAPASLSTLSVPSTRISTAAVSQPRPFGFNRRGRPSAEATTTPLPASNDQTRSKVANSEPIRLPTLKELIGRQTNDHANPSPLHLDLLSFQANHDHGKRTNFVLEEDAAQASDEPRSSEQRTRENAKNEQNFPPSGNENELDLIGGKASEYYIEDNIADADADEFNGSSSNKKRIDREDSSITSLRPTTMRGTPLINLRQKQNSRGFYVTRSKNGSRRGRTETDQYTTEFTTLPMEKDGYSVPETSTQSLTEVTTVLNEQSSIYTGIGHGETSPPDATTTQRGRRRGLSRYSESTTLSTFTDYPITHIVQNVDRIPRERVRSTTSSTDKIHRTTTETLPSLFDNLTLAPSTFMNTEFESLNAMNASQSLSEPSNSTTVQLFANGARTIPTNIDSISSISTTIPSSAEEPAESAETPYNSSTIEIETGSLKIATETGLPTQTVTESIFSTDKVSLAIIGEPKPKTRSEKGESTNNTDATIQNDQDDERHSPKDEQESLTTSASITTLPPTPIEESTEAAVTPSSRRRQKFRYNSNYEFGYRIGTGRRTRHRSKPSIEDAEPRKQTEKTQVPRRHVPIYRERPRRPVATAATINNATIPKASAPDQLTDRGEVKEIGTTTLPTTEKKGESSEKEETGETGEKVETNVIATREQGKRLEVNSSSKGTVASPRAPTSILSTSLRKPTAFSLTPAQSKSTTLTNFRKNRPTEGNRSALDEKLGTADEITEAPKAEKDIDQSGRAQEIAVTLADPPPPQSTATGRPSFRNGLRRRISTTVAPRTDASTSRSTLGSLPLSRDRQKPKPRDRPRENATNRPRRPPVIDYDYYEDEEEPVVGRSSFNGKIFLTNKGTIRCLDQGTFPHPYSCKKFITCARMVNGLVIGAEYTCPDKLSYDPVGGICNWSAGLGCRE